MRSLLCRLFVLLALLAPAAPANARPRPPVILVSIDGFRVEYLQRGVTPTLTALAADGVRAGAMRPSFPVNTFPNHYTLVTGLRPDHHGLTDNTLEDAARPGVTFKMSNRAEVRDRFWWDGAEPIWVTAERRGIRTATMYWPGSEAEVRGVRPSTWLVYDEDVAAFDRVDRLLGWLDQPPQARPAFMTLYFEAVDTVGHKSGPEGPAINRALADVDAAMARLVDGLRARGLEGKVNLVVVSDHGMAPTSPDRVALLDDLVAETDYRWVTLGAVAGLVPATADAERRLVGPHDHFTCWRKGEMPERMAYGTHPRIPPVICLAETGWVITTRARLAEHPMTTAGGSHGYDPLDPAMAALFIAHGPAFRRGVVLAPFDNVSVYPFLARLLGVKARPGDGRLEDTAAALR